jgi:hypothetical protein
MLTLFSFVYNIDLPTNWFHYIISLSLNMQVRVAFDMEKLLLVISRANLTPNIIILFAVQYQVGNFTRNHEVYSSMWILRK